MINTTAFSQGRIVTAVRLSVVVVLSGVILAACGGGAPTTDNPITSVLPQSNYNGPPPQTTDIQNFKLNVWDNIQATNRCGSCHAQGGQGNGYFVRDDDINLAYEAANLVADLALPSNSLLVGKLSTGHNCWLSDDFVSSVILTLETAAGFFWVSPLPNCTTRQGIRWAICSSFRI